VLSDQLRFARIATKLGQVAAGATAAYMFTATKAKIAIPIQTTPTMTALLRLTARIRGFARRRCIQLTQRVSGRTVRR